MKLSSKVKLATILVLLLFVEILFSVNRLDSISPSEFKIRTEGTFIVTKMDQDFLYSGIKQIASDNDRIYVLFGSRCIVNAYSKSGEYQYSIAVYDHKNGRVKIAAVEDKLYIQDKVGNIYLFAGEDFLEFVPKEDSAAITDSVVFNASTKDYAIRWGSIWDISHEGYDTCVIQRPFWLALHQNGLGTLIMIGLLAVIVGIKPKS